MGILNSIMHRGMQKEAQRIAREIRMLHDQAQERQPEISDDDFIRSIAFDDSSLNSIPDSSKARMMVCCETVNGYCYIVGLILGKFSNMLPSRALQFTKYMDDALTAEGYPPQDKTQKARILEAMELNIPDWERFG